MISQLLDLKTSENDEEEKGVILKINCRVSFLCPESSVLLESMEVSITALLETASGKACSTIPYKEKEDW